jgi:hypothetical protein
VGGKRPVWILAAALAGFAAAPAPALASRHGAPAVRLDRGFLIGLWTDNDDCSEVIEFTAEGRFIAANGGEGLWLLEGDRLTMSGSGTSTIRLIPVDRDTVTVVNADGSLGRSTRCARRQPHAPAPADIG